MPITDYDADRFPDPQDWFALEESLRIDYIAVYHEPEEKNLPNPYLHAVFHCMVENQVAMGKDTPVRAQVLRLMADGLSRHESLHAIAYVLSNHLHTARSEKKEFDEAAYYNELQALRAEDWKSPATDAGNQEA